MHAPSRWDNTGCRTAGPVIVDSAGLPFRLARLRVLQSPVCVELEGDIAVVVVVEATFPTPGPERHRVRRRVAVMVDLVSLPQQVVMWERGPTVGEVRLDVGADPQSGRRERRVLDDVLARRVARTGAGERPLAATAQRCGEYDLGFKALQFSAVDRAVYDLKARRRVRYRCRVADRQRTC